MNSLLGRVKVHHEPAAKVSAITATVANIVNNASITDSQPLTPYGPLPEYSLAQLTPVTVPHLQLCIRRKKSRKATGPDSIPVSANKRINDEIAPSLAKLFSIERFCKRKMCTNFRSTSRSEKLRTNFRNFGRETCREREMNFRDIGSWRTCTWRVQTTKMCRTQSSCENS